MRNIALPVLLAASVGLVSCGSAPEEPVEQIIVSEPGGAAAGAKQIEASAPAADDLVSQGKAAFAVCAACHSVEAGAASGPGPNLNGVIGRKAGTAEGFGFTDAMKASGVTWTEAELDSFMTDPAAKVAGTSMTAGAVNDPEARKAITAYLASLTQ